MARVDLDGLPLARVTGLRRLQSSRGTFGIGVKSPPSVSRGALRGAGEAAVVSARVGRIRRRV